MGSQSILNFPSKNIRDAIPVFEDDYGKIPDRISCGNITLHSSSVKQLFPVATGLPTPASVRSLY